MRCQASIKHNLILLNFCIIFSNFLLLKLKAKKSLSIKQTRLSIIFANFKNCNYFFKNSHTLYKKEAGMRRKFKLEMLDDYVAILRIIYFCRCHVLDESLSEPQEQQFVQACRGFEILENGAIALQENYEFVFKKFKMHDPSFCLFKNELLKELNKPISKDAKQKVSAEKLAKYEDKLKSLQAKHSLILFKFKKKLAK